MMLSQLLTSDARERRECIANDACCMQMTHVALRMTHVALRMTHVALRMVHSAHSTASFVQT